MIQQWKYFLILFLATVFVGAFSGCNGLEEDPTADTTTPPKIISTTPSMNDSNAELNLSIKITFDKDLDANTLSQSSVTLSDDSENISGSISYSNRIITFTPDEDLKMETLYTATVANTISDIDGNFLDKQYRWSFTTSNPLTGQWKGETSEGTPYGLDFISTDLVYNCLIQSDETWGFHGSYENETINWVNGLESPITISNDQLTVGSIELQKNGLPNDCNPFFTKSIDENPEYVRASKLLGEWTFEYTLSSTWTEWINMSFVSSDTASDNEYFIWGDIEYGDMVIGGYDAESEEYMLYYDDGLFENYYTFAMNSDGTTGSGCFYFSESGGYDLYGCYDLEVVKQSGDGVQKVFIGGIQDKSSLHKKAMLNQQPLQKSTVLNSKLLELKKRSDSRKK